MAAQSITENRDIAIVSVHTMPDVVVLELHAGAEIELSPEQAAELSALLSAAATNAPLIEWSEEDDEDGNPYAVVKDTGERFGG